MTRDDIKEKALTIYPHIFPILLFASLEIQNTTRVFSNMPAFLISCVLLYVSLWVLFSLTGKAFISGLLVSVTLLTFYTVSFYRQMQTGQVLIPHDLNLVRHVGSIFAFSNIAFHWQPVCSILLTAALLIPLFHISRSMRLSITKRAVAFAVSGVLMYLLFFTRFSQKIILPSVLTSMTAKASYNEIYREQGALLGFYTISITEDVDEPDGYSRAHMEALAAKILENTPAYDPEESIKPNVIIVMSEAYWDPTKLPNITFSEDPVPFLHEINDVVTSGNVLAPTFGDMTSNTEFELLTGHAMRFVGYGDIPYYDEPTYIDSDNGRSLVSMFKANGYSTVALHTYTATFFSRDVIYPKLGFDAFIAAEDMPDAHIKGSLRGQEMISDEYFCDILIETVESAVDPLFLFGITVQNHTPYLPDKYDSTRIQSDSGGLLLDEDNVFVETYLEGVYDADVVLGRLYDFVMESEEPTILLYFGDHLPLLTRHTGVYTELGYVDEGELEELSAEDAYKLFTTPYVAFSNYSELPVTWGDISPFFMGAIIADEADIEMNLYYHFLIQAFEHFQALNPYLCIADGSISSAPGEEENDMLEMFEAFQYDKLFGEGYVSEIMSSFP